MSKVKHWIWLAAAALAAASPLAARAAEPLCPKADPSVWAPSPASLDGAETYVYKTVGGQPLRLYLRRPPAGTPGPARRPAVVFFTGGGWMFLNVKSPTPQAEYLARRGAISVVVDYRVYCRDGVSIREQVEDAKSAMSWLRAHGKQLGVDPGRIAAFGGSSGGHIALSTAMFDQLNDRSGSQSVSPHPNLLVLFFPCVDETTEIELQYSAKAIQTYGAELSPALHVTPGLPPMFVGQGTADPLHDENIAYCAKVNAAGNSCTLVEYKDAPHGFLRQGQPFYDAGMRDMDAFLVRHGYLPPSQTSSAG
jgi:acetyl esterase/lipase